MINYIIDILQLNDWHGKSDAIEIAKGKNELPLTWSDIKKRFKRKLKWELRKR